MRTAAICCTLIGVTVVGLAQSIDDPGVDTLYGARFWPVLLAIALIVINIPSALFPNNRSGAPDAPAAPTPWQSIASINWASFLLPTTLVFAYPLAVEGLGFPLASMALYLLLMLVLGQRAGLATLAIGVMFPLTLAYFFTRVAYMPLPKGMGPFEDLTIQLYRIIGAY